MPAQPLPEQIADLDRRIAEGEQLRAERRQLRFALREAGYTWNSIASISGVSIAAVQKDVARATHPVGRNA